MKSRIISIVNQKGGVGKTTTAVTLSGGLAKSGYKVCLIDMDHQGNATTSLGVNVDNKPTIAELLVLQESSMDDVLIETYIKNLHLVPSDISLAKADKRLNTEGGREFRLRNKVLKKKKDYDFIIIDCPPSLTNLFENAMTTSTEYLIPIQLDSFSVSGVSQLLGEIKKLESDVFVNVNHKTKMLGALITLFEKSTKISKSVGQDIEEIFGDKLFKNKIPKNTTIKDAQNNEKIILDYDPDSNSSKAYNGLIKEVLER
jgi:chromosome partitioning protein